MIEEEDQLTERNNFESEEAAAGEQEGQVEGQGPEEAEGGLTLESVINNFNTATSSLAADFYYRFSRILQEREEIFRVSNIYFTSRVHALHYTAFPLNMVGNFRRHRSCRTPFKHSSSRRAGR